MYRAFYAIPATMKMSNGEQTNAVYGVASMLISLLKTEQPTHLLFCFDAGEETFRHQENATYKEGRAETPDEFYVQIPRILSLLDAFPLQHVSDPKLEADDLLCAYAKAGEAAGMQVTIITGDRDALQLATEKVRIAIPHKGYQAPEYLGPKEILAKYGVRPDQVPSYKGISGDSSDNLPGVKGIGPKGASALLQKYGSLTGVYEHLEEISPVLRAKLLRDREQAFFCERMATLVCNYALPTAVPDLALTTIKTEGAIALLRELQFNSLLKRLEGLCRSDYGRQHFLFEGAAEKPVTKVKNESQMMLF